MKRVARIHSSPRKTAHEQLFVSSCMCEMHITRQRREISQRPWKTSKAYHQAPYTANYLTCSSSAIASHLTKRSHVCQWSAVFLRSYSAYFCSPPQKDSCGFAGRCWGDIRMPLLWANTNTNGFDHNIRTTHSAHCHPLFLSAPSHRSTWS